MKKDRLTETVARKGRHSMAEKRIKKIELIVASLECFVELLETYRQEEERKRDEDKKTDTNCEDEWETEYQNDHIIMAEAKIQDAISLLQF